MPLPEAHRRLDRHSATAQLARILRLPRIVLAALFGICLLPSGCCSLSWRPDANEVVAARELAGQGLEAQQDGNDAEAAERFAQAIEICPVDERCRRHYAEVLWRQGVGVEAINQMSEAVRLSGGDPLLRVRLGEMHLAMGDHQSALRQADLAIARAGDLSPAWALRGDLFHRSGELPEALACYHRALRYEPQNPPVQIAVARIHRDMGRPERSLAVLDAAVDQFSPGAPPVEVLVHHGRALKELGRFDQAVESLKAAAERSGRDAEIFYELADARRQAGDLSGAKLAVRQVLEINPHHAAGRQLEIALRQPQPVAATLTR
ncbi:MAG: tetratricopeptide repeat protein [Planctomycetes bacterium]|nr:tetratricopeptide repeat protein [Planctomycetota bacterium]